MTIRLLGLLRKELIQFFQDRWVLALILWLYTAEVVLCTYALSFEVEQIPMAVVDQDISAASHELLQPFHVSDAFDVVLKTTSREEGAAALASGKVGMVLIIPADFFSSRRPNSGASLQLLLDGTNSNTAANARNHALQLIRQYEVPPGVGAPVDTPASAVPVTRIWYNPEQTTTAFMALSMIALAGMMVGVIHPAASIVREKEHGTVEQLLVTPIGVGELFAAKTVPAWMMGTLSLFPSLLIIDWFDVPLRGSFLLFLALTGVFLMSAIALGVLIATVSRTLQQALLLAFFGLFPIMFLSGSLTPVESMPEFLQTLSLGSPLRYYMDIILGVFLKGAGWRELWQEAAVLAAIGGVLYLAAWAVFRRQVA